MYMEQVNLAIQKYTNYLGLNAIVVIGINNINKDTYNIIFSNGKKLLIKFVADDDISITTNELKKDIDDFLFVTPLIMLYDKMYYHYLLCNNNEIKSEIQNYNYDKIETTMCFLKRFHFNKDRMIQNVCFSI